MAKAFNKVLGIIMVIAILLSLGVTTLAEGFGTVTFLGKTKDTNTSSYVYGGTTANIIVIKQASTAFVAWVDETVPDAEIITAVKAGDPSLDGMAGYVTRSTSFNLGVLFGLPNESQYKIDVNIDTANKIITTSKDISHFTFYSYGSPPVTPDYGSLAVAKTVSGTGASGSEKFAITVDFSSDFSGITNSANISGTNGRYLLSLSADDAPVTFSNIPMGVSYTVSEELSTAQTGAGWTAGEISNGTGTVSSTTPIAVTVNNSYEAPPLTDYKSLEIIKKVAGSGASHAEEFAIRVVFSVDYEGINNSAGLSGTNGTYLLSLHHNESVIFSNIPEGVSYTVSEELSTAQTKAGWSKGATDGGIGTLCQTPHKTVTVNNIYTKPQTPTYTSLKVIKNASGEGAPLNEKFAITVDFDGNFSGITNNVLGLSGDSNGTYQLSLSHGESVIFSNIPPGVTYTVTETLTPTQKNAGWSLNAITGSGMGTLCLPTNPNPVTVAVYNIFTAPPEYGNLMVDKEVYGEGADLEEKFNITVVFTIDEPIPQAFTLATGGSLSGIENSLDLVPTEGGGTYNFSLSADDAPVTFSNIPMGVSYTVSEELSTAQTTVGWTAGEITNGSGAIADTEAIAVTVNNSYEAPLVYGSLEVDKVVTGTGASGSEKFNITVVFTIDEPTPRTFTLGTGGPLSGIENSLDLAPTTEGGGTYSFQLSADDEPVIFSNIPMGVSYTVSEELSTAQTAAGWTRRAITNDSGTVHGTATIEAVVGNVYGQTPPPVYIEYGSLKVEKNVSGDNASETEEFEITVLFTGNYASIANNAGVSGTGGVYVLSLHDGESVIFSNIPMGVRYTVTENLSEAQTTAGWVAPEPAGGIINSTNRVNLTVENIYAEAEPQGEDEDIEDPDEDEDPVVDPEGDTEDVEDPGAKLPQTGGIPKSAILGLIGLLFVLSGAVLSIVNRRKKTQ